MQSSIVKKKFPCHRKTTDDSLFRAVDNLHLFWQYLNILSVLRKTNFLNFSVNRSIFVSDRLWSSSYYDFRLSLKLSKRQLLRPTTVSLSRLIQHKMNRFSHGETYIVRYTHRCTPLFTFRSHILHEKLSKKNLNEKESAMYYFQMYLICMNARLLGNIEEWKMAKVLTRL